MDLKKHIEHIEKLKDEIKERKDYDEGNAETKARLYGYVLKLISMGKLNCIACGQLATRALEVENYG